MDTTVFIDVFHAGPASRGTLFFIREIANLWYSTPSMGSSRLSGVVLVGAAERYRAGELIPADRAWR